MTTPYGHSISRLHNTITADNKRLLNFEKSPNGTATISPSAPRRTVGDVDNFFAFKYRSKESSKLSKAQSTRASPN